MAVASSLEKEDEGVMPIRPHRLTTASRRDLIESMRAGAYALDAQCDEDHSEEPGAIGRRNRDRSSAKRLRQYAAVLEREG